MIVIIVIIYIKILILTFIPLDEALQLFTELITYAALNWLDAAVIKYISAED